MAHINILLFVILLSGWTGFAEETGSDATSSVREPRGARRRCRKYGICPGGFGGHGGSQGGFGGFQGNQGYPPINIGISQSQSSANTGGGGYGHGQYPNNYQYNGGFGGGYGQYRPQYPGYLNGQGAYNNQFNGNYFGPGNGYYSGGFQGGYPGYQGGYQGYQGGFGYQGPFGNGPYYDEAEKPVVEHSDYNEHDIGGSGSYAEAGLGSYGRKNSKN